MSKRIKTGETLGDKINEALAENVTDLFCNGMNEDQFGELTKDESNPRPENCVGLATVKTNQLIWDIISPQAQSVERKMQIIERAIVKASTVLVNTVNKMAATDENSNAIDGCNDALAILGHTNRKVISQDVNSWNQKCALNMYIDVPNQLNTPHSIWRWCSKEGQRN